MRVYHLSKAKYAIQNLERKRLKVATFEDLNDPFELLGAKLPKRSVRDAFRGFKRDLHGQIGLLCFGQRWDSPLMWSHYADNHRGICLGFDIPEQYAIAVQYIGARMAVKFQDNLPAKGVDPTFSLDIMRSKYIGWSYENEVRMFVGLDESDQESGLYFHNFASDLILREVILGERYLEPVAKIMGLAAAVDGSVRVVKARLAFNSFRVVINKAASRIR